MLASSRTVQWYSFSLMPGFAGISPSNSLMSYMRAYAAAGATEFASTHETWPEQPSSTSAQNMYPPTSAASGASTPEAIQDAAAASIALPPEFRIAAPIRAAVFGSVATAPRGTRISLPSIMRRSNGESRYDHTGVAILKFG